MFRRDWFGVLVGTALLVTTLVGCVETEVLMRINTDGSGLALMQQAIPRILMSDTKQQFMVLEKNDVILRDEEEVRKVFGEREGVHIVNVAVTDVADIKNYRLPNDMRGIRHVRTELTFDDVRDLSLSHFSFRYIRGWDADYFVMFVSKTLESQEQINQPYGGMGVFTASATEGRMATFKIQLPTKVLAHNANDQDWNTLTWRVPVGALYNAVQEDIVGWTKLAPSTSGMTAAVNEAKRLLFSEDWAKPINLPPYFVLPIYEPGAADVYRGK